MAIILKYFLDNIKPDLIYYEETDGYVTIEFKNSEMETNDSLSNLKWMAPEVIRKESEPVSLHSEQKLIF